MKKSRKVLSVLLATIMTASLFAGCSSGSSDTGSSSAASTGESSAAASEESTSTGNSSGKDELIVAFTADPPTLDPHSASSSSSVNALQPVYETLVRYDENGEITPLLATEWEQIDDLNWRFKLRDDVYFHNGEKMTANDVLYSFTRATGPDGAKVSYIMSAIDAENCKVEDDYTIVIATHEPFAPLVGYLPYIGAVVVSEKEFTEDPEKAANNPVGTGPFKFVEWSKNDHVSFTRNDDYWGDKPAYKDLTIRTIVEANSRVIELEAGTVDIAMDIPANDVERIANGSNTYITRCATTMFDFLGMNTSKEPFNDVNFRLGIDYAINEEAIAQSVYRGIAQYTPQTVTPNMKYFDDSDMDCRYDVEKAKEYLAKAGVQEGATFTIYTSETTPRINACTVIQSMLAEVGINLEIQTYESGTFLEMCEKGETEFLISGWGAVGFPEPDNNLYGPYSSNQIPVNNYTFYSDPKIDEMLEAQRTTPDGPERETIIKDLQKYLRTVVPLIPLYNLENVIGCRSNVKGFTPTPATSHFYHKVYFE